ncbi:MAG: hypothetical protein QGD90_01100 [Candidatus Hydrogenedentes bacterium]|nr:hypothetical protein [Candidatus Hydrogenedentota bacterium]
MPRAWPAAAFVVAAGLASAQVDVKAVLSPPIIPYHKQAAFTVVVEAPAGVVVKLPDMRDHFGKLAVYGVPDYHSEPIGEDRVRITETYVLDPVHIRHHVIAPVEVTWGDANVIAVPSPTLRVRDLTPEELEEAKRFEGAIVGGPGATGPGYSGLWTWLGGIAVALAAVAALIFYLRGRRALPSGPTAKDVWVIAKERLAALAERKLPQLGKYDAYYVDLSSILRYYIEGRFQVHAPERTTPEFLAEISGKGYFSPEQEVFLARFLRLCDRVKFAQFRPDLEAMTLSFEEVERFVEETIPRPELEEEAIAA